jgi:GxxExxY protein
MLDSCVMNAVNDDFPRTVIGLAIDVHRELGPGLLESAYDECLAYELRQASIRFFRQEPVPIVYKGLSLDCGYRLDLLVEDRW